MHEKYDHLFFYFLKGKDKNVGINNTSILNAKGNLKKENIHFLDHTEFYKYLNQVNNIQKYIEIRYLLECQFADPIVLGDESGLYSSALSNAEPYSKTKCTAPVKLTSIPLKEKDLIGRKNDIKAIREQLNQYDIVSIRADGGVGKTAVALEIINQVKREITSGVSAFKHIAWINSKGDFKIDLTLLNVPTVNQKKTLDEKYDVVSIFLQRTPTLLVIDNINKSPSKKELDDLNTISGKTKVLITSRVNINYVEEYTLKELNPKDAVVLFYRYFTKKKLTIEEIWTKDDSAFAEMIVKAAAYNTLFIELIGKMAYAEHMSLEWLWEKLSNNVFGLNSKYPVYTTHGDDGKLLEHIQKLYEMSNLTKRQKEIMSFIALFPAEQSIFYDVFTWAGFEDDKKDNLGILQERGWIVRDQEGYLIHTIVKGSVEQQRGRGIFDEEKYEKLIDELSYTDDYIPKDMEYTKVHERLAVPVTICKLIANNGSNSFMASELFKNIGVIFLERGNYDEAMNYFKEALEICKNVMGEDHFDTALIQMNMGLVYDGQGNFSEALRSCEKAKVICENELGEKHLCTAKLYNNMGIVYGHQGKYDEAMRYFRKALIVFKNELGEEHPNTISAYYNIGIVCFFLRKYNEAMMYFKLVLAIRRNKLGEEHPDIASVYNSIGAVYHEQGNYDKALNSYQNALLIRKKVLGEEHPYTVLTSDNIERIYRALQ